MKIRILGVAPYDNMRVSIERAAEAFPDIDVDVYTGDLEEGVSIVKNLKTDDYDAVVSRGGTAEMISRVTSLPVIRIPISVYDVLRCIKLAENYSSAYAIVAFPSITETAYTLCDLLRYRIDIYTINGSEEVVNRLRELQKRNYRMIIGDVVTYTMARQMGFDAILITSGAESLHDALELARFRGESYQRIRRENQLLQGLMQMDDGHKIVLQKDGSLLICIPENVPEALISVLRSHIRRIPQNGALRFYHHQAGVLHAVAARQITVRGEKLYIFQDQPTQVPLHAGRLGIHSMGKDECEHLFLNSFYSISGAMGELEAHLNAIAVSRQPVIILGETGTGKEQIARALYLRGKMNNNPFIVVDCTVMDEKSWDYLLRHSGSPLYNSSCTIYFQHMEDMPSVRQSELISLIEDTGLMRRERLFFSCDCLEDETPPIGREFSARLGCLVLHMPPLRSRVNEISSLASLYINELNLELGKQISGIDPHGLELLRQYDWPNNYTQFKQVLHELAVLASSAYISSSSVAEQLAKQRSFHRSPSHGAQGVVIEGRTLQQITMDVVLKTIQAHGGNQSTAARQLGISRSTLWRYVNHAQAKPEEADD